MSVVSIFSIIKKANYILKRRPFYPKIEKKGENRTIVEFLWQAWSKRAHFLIHGSYTNLAQLSALEKAYMQINIQAVTQSLACVQVRNNALLH